MNIIHVITTIDRGGAEKHLLQLATAQVETGHIVKIIFLKGKAELSEEFNNSGCHVITNLSDKKFISQITKLRKLLRNFDGKIHAHLPRAELLTALCTKNKFVISRHNAEKFFPSAPSFLSRILSRLVSSRSCTCIAISESVHDFLITNKEICMTTPIRVIHYGMKYRSLQPSISKKELLQEIKIPENSSILGTIARLVPQKDYPTLLKALKLVLDTHPDTYLIAVGEGPLRFKLVELASKLGIQDHVKWIGKVENVDDYLQILDTFILSSTYEGFGLVLLEAANARIPIVATNTSAIPEVLGKDYPFLARPRDAMDFSTLIVRSLSKENYSFFLHENQNIMENFSVDKMLSKTIEVYENCK